MQSSKIGFYRQLSFPRYQTALSQPIYRVILSVFLFESAFIMVTRVPQSFVWNPQLLAFNKGANYGKASISHPWDIQRHTTSQLHGFDPRVSWTPYFLTKYFWNPRFHLSCSSFVPLSHNNRRTGAA